MDERRVDFRSILASAGLLLPLLALAPPAVADQSRRGADSFDRGRRDLAKVALTFDGGSAAGESELILDVLRERGVQATFFLTGEFIRHNPELTRRIVTDGHEVGNHTSTHPHLTSWNRTRRHETLVEVDQTLLEGELREAARAFESVTGASMLRLWRAPYGEVNRELLEWAVRAGWSHVGWTRDDGGLRTLDSLDWVAERSSRNYLTSAEIAARIRSFGAGQGGLNGGIVLMHLCTRREDPHVTRLKDLIDSLRGDGYRLVTVTELRRDADAAPMLSALAAVLTPRGD